METTVVHGGYRDSRREHGNYCSTWGLNRDNGE